MSKYLVTGYLVTPYNLIVEADTEAEAEEIGIDLIENEEQGEQGEAEFLPDWEVEKWED